MNPDMNAEQLADAMEAEGHHNTAAMLRKQDYAIKQLREALYMIQGDKRTCIQLDGHIKAALAATEEFNAK